MERYRRSEKVIPEKTISYKERLKKQAIISAFILLVVFCIGLLKTETAQILNERIYDAISYTVDYQAATKGVINAVLSFAKEVGNAF